MFFGFNTAVRGLLASQRSLYTTNHNISNQTTPGYSRQYVGQSATKAHHLPGIGYIGTGTQINDVKRARDSFVDYKYWNEMSPLGEWAIKNESLNEIEKIMGEPSDNSFTKYIDDFYKGLEDLTKDPGDVALREPVIETGQAFTGHIKDVYKRLDNMKKDTIINTEIKIKQVNQLGEQIASLNRQIYSEELDGNNANDLRDRRELLVDQLSEIVNINVSETQEGRFDISISGTSLVNHFNSEKIVLDRKALDGFEKFDSEYKIEDIIKWSNGSSVKIKSGELKGLRDMLTGNGENNSYRGIPYYMKQLNDFAKGFADKFNEQHSKGYDLDGNKGKDFFTYNDDNPAGSMAISKEILADIRKFAAAANTNKEGFEGDAGNLHKLIKQREDREFFSNEDGLPNGTAEDFIKSLVSSVGVDTLQSERFLGTQKLIQKNLENRRSSISGVSMNEEMADMVRFQKTYIASSKMINTLDNLLDITVNRLGMVGR